MDMFGVGWVEMALIGIVALLVYGRDLPDAMRKAGRVMGDLRKNLDKVKEEIQREMPKASDLPKVDVRMDEGIVSYGGEHANVPEPVKDVEAPPTAPPVGESERLSVGESGGTADGAHVGQSERPSVGGSGGTTAGSHVGATEGWSVGGSDAKSPEPSDAPTLQPSDSPTLRPVVSRVEPPPGGGPAGTGS